MRTIIIICCLLFCSTCYADKASYEAELALRKVRVQARKEEKASYRHAAYLVRKYGSWHQYSYWYITPYRIYAPYYWRY